jgi:hypothetical protein
MNDSYSDSIEDAAVDRPVRLDETAIRTMLEHSRRDIAEGRTQSLAPVLDRMRAIVNDVRMRCA